MTAKAINDDIANACASAFFVHEVVITTTVPYRPHNRELPGGGRVETLAHVQVAPRDLDRLPDEPVEPFETQHPAMPDQRVRWIHGEATETRPGWWTLTLVGVRPS